MGAAAAKRGGGCSPKIESKLGLGFLGFLGFWESEGIFFGPLFVVDTSLFIEVFRGKIQNHPSAHALLSIWSLISNLCDLTLY